MFECSQIFTICLGWEFLADSNVIACMQLLTRFAKSCLLRKKLSLLGPENLIAFTLVTELGKTLSDGQNMPRYERKPDRREGFGERDDH